MTLPLTKTLLAVGTLFLASNTWAAVDTANLAVSATVVNVCAIGPGTLAFGALGIGVNAGLGTSNPVNTDADSGSSISIICTNGASATITAGFGANASASVRRMISGADYLTYELYTDAGRLTALNATNAISYTGTGAATTTQAVYGRITGTQLAAAKKGTYSDTVTMTITYTP